MKTKGFTLIELLVVISIIGVLIGVSIFGLQGARESSRNAKRKSDLELVRAGLETYKLDCGVYPDTLTFGSSLEGDDSKATCDSANVYIAELPIDPTSPAAEYVYFTTGYTYELCAALENSDDPAVTCGGASGCGTETCNYKTISP